MAETTKIDLMGVQRNLGKRIDCKRPMLKELHGAELRPPILIDKPDIFIGRDPSCEIMLDDIKVSRRHAQIIYENFEDRAAVPRVRIKDLGSTNKTFVNSQEIAEAELRDNDTISIGSTSFGLFLRDESNIRAEQRLVELASNDGLTGLRNRAYFDMAYPREFSKARAQGRELSIIIFDLDHFKKINDGHGHPIGDHVLREMGRIAATTSRSRDLAARYGGEEFVFVLPETGLENACMLAERLRKRVEEHNFSVGSHELKVSISAGVASLSEAEAEPAELLKFADKALYKAKETGRNRVCRQESEPRKSWPVAD